MKVQVKSFLKQYFEILIFILVLCAVFFIKNKDFTKFLENAGINFFLKDQELVNESIGCNARPGLDNLQIPENAFKKSYRNKKRAIVIDGIPCYKVGSQIPISIYYHLGPNLKVFDRTEGLAEITKIVRTKLSKITDELALDVFMDDANKLKAVNLATPGNTPDMDLYFVYFDIIRKGYRNSSLSLNLYPDFARIVSYEEAKRLAADGARWIDTRSEAAFNQQHFPLAVNIPYSSPSKNFFEVFKPYEAFSKLDNFAVTALPKNKELPLIFSGEDNTDFLPLRAIVTAKLQGWNNLYWYRAGESERQIQLALNPPDSVTGLFPLTAAQSLDLMSRGAIPVYVGPNLVFVKYHVINGSINMPFVLSKNMPVADRISFEALVKSGINAPIDKLPQLKDTKLIFYGSNSTDWNALAAAIWAKGKGWNNVYWYQGGLLDWQAHNELDPDTYKLNN